MKSLLTIATASINTIPLDITHNSELIIDAVTQAKKEKVDLLLLPELCLSGYGAEDMFFSQGFLAAMPQALKHIAKHLDEGMLVAVGFPLLIPGEQVFNACAVLTKDKIITCALKQHLARSGIHYEPRWFSPWPKDETTRLVIADDEVVVGDIVLNVAGIKIGFEICEDAWVASRPGRSGFQKGVDIILNPSASHYALGKQEDRLQFCQEGSRAFGCVYVYANFVGCEAGRAIYDGGNVIASEGKLVALGQRFSFQTVTVETAVVDIEANRAKRIASSESMIKNDNDNEISIDFKFKGHAASSINGKVDKPKTVDNDNVAKAIALALWDWQRKTKQKGYVISLSGGADSGLCASLVYLAHRLALDELGSEKYCQTLAQLGLHLTKPKTANEAWLKKDVMPKVLTTVYQSTKNSSDITREAAKTLAEDIGAKHHQWSVDELVDAYVERIDATLDKPLNWQDDDITLQNIQARVRSPGVWLMANKENKLLLSTSNLSEASVGYCTMDGDTSGVLAPIGGVSKSMVLKVNAFLHDTGVRLKNEKASAVVKGLAKVIAQKPTAELRPVEQTDEADLMPFEVLDTIRRLSQVAYFDPASVYERLIRQTFSQRYDEAQLKTWTERYFMLYSRNQWKRERLAVSLHIEVDSACPKTYRRFPVLNRLSL